MKRSSIPDGRLAGIEGINLNLLRYLLVLVQERSVSRAADRVYVTQPAMSAALKRLREAFHDPILVRAGQVTTPTPRAKEIAAAVDQMLQSVNLLALDRADFDPATAQQRFTLMCSD